MKYKAIIFDNAGVLINENHKRWSKKIADYYQLDANYIYQKYSRSEAWPLFKHGQINEEQFWQMGNKISRKNLDIKILKKIVRENRIPIKETINLLSLIKDNYLLGLLNNEAKEWDLYSQKKESFYNLFSLFVSSHTTGISKPDPEIYQIMITKLAKKQILPQETIYVDDRQNNCDAAGKLGFYSILFTDHNKLINHFQKINIIQ